MVQLTTLESGKGFTVAVGSAYDTMATFSDLIYFLEVLFLHGCEERIVVLYDGHDVAFVDLNEVLFCYGRNFFSRRRTCIRRLARLVTSSM